jgi:tRNA A-37 threonylcarbamoyl transferase component Bud32
MIHSARMDELPATFGKYYLTDKLATGGMAEIYLGKILGPAGFEKQLVIKQIHPTLSDKHHFVDLFVAEAKTLVGLAHGNIVPVYELGVVDDIYYIAMEYIDGPTLYRLTEAVARAGARIAPPLAAWIAAEILDGLDYAHRKGEGVIHRDLSPRNVMVSRDGEVKLVDFGIAVGTDDGGEGEGSGDGAPTGSFPYMSPEQVRREKLTGQSDLFSVGVLLWEMLTGKRLFARTTPDATLAAVLEAPIAPPSSIQGDVPARVDEVVLRALARDPAERWASAADFGAALNRWLYSLEPMPGPRDLAAVVARHCPPIRATTDDDEDDDDVLTEAASAPPSTDAGAGPATQVVARATGMTTPVQADARGKRRPGTIRELSFATHVDLERALARATPLFPIAAIRDDAGAAPAGPLTGPDTAPATAPPRPPPASTERARTAAGETSPPPRPTREPAAPDVTARTPRAGTPRVGVWIAVAAIAIAGYGGYRVLGHRAGTDAPPDAPLALTGPADAGTLAAVPSDGAAPATDAGALAAAPPDARRAGRPPDARHGALPGPGADAAPAHPRPDARPAASARLVVGADPWGEVYVDGHHLGRTPFDQEIPAGHHEIEVRFPAVDPPLSKTFQVDLAPGADQKLFAPFPH